MGEPPLAVPEDSLPDDLSLPVTGVTYLEAKEFCEKLTIMDPDGIVYSLPSELNFAYAGYGFEVINGMVDVNDLQRTGNVHEPFQPVDIPSPNSLEFRGLQGNVAEWLEGVVYRKPVWDGVKSFREDGEHHLNPSVALFGLDERSLVVHAFDMYSAVNEHFVEVEGLEEYVEEDQVTRYLCPTERGQPGRLVYRYETGGGVREARVRCKFDLVLENACYGAIKIRWGASEGLVSERADVGAEVPKGAEWVTVFEQTGPYVGMPSVDLTPWVEGAHWVEVMYELVADELPLNHVQWGRSLPSRQDLLNLFQAEVHDDQPALRSTIVVPANYANQRVGFRVSASGIAELWVEPKP